ncbi:transporter substrate-binding domain-containing protein [Agrococcus sp. Ld7]|uniref:transporter substrate-binding domain-containing protein n=1 Tax=Agrococcus sp. Ld7 TaxID=649148 RepID=UPI00386CDE9D
MRRSLPGLVVTAAAAILLGGCASIPADPDGTLERVQGGTLRVGVTENAPWVVLGEGDDPTGTEPELVRAFAERVDAEVEWTQGSETRLADALEGGELDLVVGGLLDDTPWAEVAAVTRPYAEVNTANGTERHVMLTPMGENAFLVELETFLDAEAAQ